MITLLHNPTTATAVFSARDLPDEVQAPVLRNIVMSRVVSTSMRPTLRDGDYLDLGPADTVQVGDLVVFRLSTWLICHRVVRIGSHYLHTKGDAVDGLAEQISPSDVVGCVTAIVRNGMRLSISPPPPHPQRQQSTIHRPVCWSREQVRSLIRQEFARVIMRPAVGRVIGRIIFHLITLDVMEQAPLRSLTGSMPRRAFRLTHIGQLHQYLAARTDLTGIILAVRAGPVLLGSCRLTPWSLSIRPAAVSLGLDTYLQSLGRYS